MGLYELISGAKFLLLAIRKPTLLNPIPKKGSKKNSTLSYTDSVLRLFFLETKEYPRIKFAPKVIFAVVLNAAILFLLSIGNII